MPFFLFDWLLLFSFLVCPGVLVCLYFLFDSYSSRATGGRPGGDVAACRSVRRWVGCRSPGSFMGMVFLHDAHDSIFLIRAGRRLRGGVVAPRSVRRRVGTCEGVKINLFEPRPERRRSRSALRPPTGCGEKKIARLCLRVQVKHGACSDRIKLPSYPGVGAKSAPSLVRFLVIGLDCLVFLLPAPNVKGGLRSQATRSGASSWRSKAEGVPLVCAGYFHAREFASWQTDRA